MKTKLLILPVVALVPFVAMNIAKADDANIISEFKSACATVGGEIKTIEEYRMLEGELDNGATYKTHSEECVFDSDSLVSCYGKGVEFDKVMDNSGPGYALAHGGGSSGYDATCSSLLMLVK
ncbi:MAG: hypothetical protein LBH81_00465 [Rickettsiales bacterium]|jgi:hypothetical protein|nr:hypothetical protein [Rickettsiales bacterium]